MRWVGLYMVIAGLLVIVISARAPTANWALFYFALALVGVGLVLVAVDLVLRWHPWRRRGFR